MLDSTAYLAAYAAAVARQHRPQWSWARMRKLCSCGSELPCRTLTAVPPSIPGHWPA